MGCYRISPGFTALCFKTKQGCQKENVHARSKEATTSTSLKNASGRSIHSSATAVTIPTLWNARFRQSLPANAASDALCTCLSARAYNLCLLACCVHSYKSCGFANRCRRTRQVMHFVPVCPRVHTMYACLLAAFTVTSPEFPLTLAQPDPASQSQSQSPAESEEEPVCSAPPLRTHTAHCCTIHQIGVVHHVC